MVLFRKMRVASGIHGASEDSRRVNNLREGSAMDLSRLLRGRSSLAQQKKLTSLPLSTRERTQKNYEGTKLTAK